MLLFYLVFFRAGALEDLEPGKKEKAIRFEIPRSLQYLIYARFFLLSGILIISTFLVFVVRDYLGAAETEKTTALLYTWSIAGAILSAIPAGKLVKKKGEIPVLFISGISLACYSLDRHSLHDHLRGRICRDHIFRAVFNGEAHSPSPDVRAGYGNNRFQYLPRPVSGFPVRGRAS